MEMLVVVLAACLVPARGLVDVSLAQLQLLSNRLSQTECRRLVASLYDASSYQLQANVANSGLLLPASAPCEALLLTWSEGPVARDATHELLARRLRQLGHPRLAAWLARAVFRELAEELRHNKILQNPPEDIPPAV